MRLEFETTSSDNRGRMISPINITTLKSDSTTIDFKNVINAHKEWAWKYLYFTKYFYF